jgi:hypothetical protein
MTNEKGERHYAVWLRGSMPEGWEDGSWVLDRDTESSSSGVTDDNN